MSDDISGILAQRHASKFASVVKPNALTGIEIKADPVMPGDLEFGGNNVERATHAKVGEEVERLARLESHADILASPKERGDRGAREFLNKGGWIGG